MGLSKDHFFTCVHKFKIKMHFFPNDMNFLKTTSITIMKKFKTKVLQNIFLRGFHF
jgi:hypothetical protein